MDGRMETLTPNSDFSDLEKAFNRVVRNVIWCTPGSRDELERE